MRRTFLAATFSAVLVAGIASAAASAAADGSDAPGSQFVADGCTYSVVTPPEGSDPGTVQLSGIDRSASKLVIPSSVASPMSGTTYTVDRVNFAAFNNDTALIDVTLPASIENVLSGANSAFFYGCSSLKSISVSVSGDSTKAALASEGGVLYAVNDGEKATLLAYPQQKTGDSFDVPKTVSTIAPYAFAGNEQLVKVTFQSGLEGESDRNTSTLFQGGIRASAFEGCSKLESVSFPAGARIGTVLTSASAAIGSSAFKDCTNLQSISIPEIATADQKANAYQNFSQLNPESHLSIGNDQSFTSGYAPYWHNGSGPIARPGMDSGVFEGCTALASVTFEAGNSTGARAYWVSGANEFVGCTALKSLVFESAQAYWGDPNASMQNGTFTDIWSADYNDLTAPDYYYAIDYYASEDAARAADAAGSTRLARVEYKRGTSTAAIATGDEALAGQTADRALYAQHDADGTILDPDEAAAQAGLAGTGWVWKLDGTQARRTGLTESCRAYLAKASDLSGGRIDSAQTEALYLQADRNLSQGTSLCPDSPFDVERYGADESYSMDPLASETSPYCTYNPTTGELDTSFAVIAADGTALEPSQYATSYQRYDMSTKALKGVEKVSSGGAYLVTITPTTGDYTGQLQEWVLVRPRTGNLVEAYGDTPLATESAAKYPYSQTSSIDYSAAPYSVTIGAKDVPGALVASSCVGLVRGAINVDTTKAAKRFGFELNRSTYPNGSVRDSGQTRTFARSTPAPEFAVAVYEHLKDASNRDSYGISDASCNWGDTALLVPLGHVADMASVSAYAYAQKAPVFFTEVDGSCSKATRKALKDFRQVKAVGNTKLYSAKAFSKLQGQLGSGTKLARIGASAKTRGALSLAIADELVASSKAFYTATSISDATDPMDCILALNFTGHEGGVTLVSGSTAQSKRIMKRLHENIGNLELVQLYGRTKNNATVVSSKTYGSKNAFGAIWESDDDFENIYGSIATTVEDAQFSAKSVDPDYEPAKKAAGKKTGASHGQQQKAQVIRPAAVTGAGVDNSHTPSLPPAPSRAGISKDESAHNSSSDATNKKTPADASGSAAKTPVAADQVQASNPNTAASAGETPIWMKAVFIVVLLALCGALIPILRKCR